MHPSPSPRSRGKKKRGPQALGRSHGGHSSKIHILCNKSGDLLGLKTTPGQASDYKEAYNLASAKEIEGAKVFLADKGYDSRRMRDLVSARGMEAVIPPRAIQKVQYSYDKTKYKMRNRVERLIGKYKENRRIATRFDKLTMMYEGFILLAAIKDTLKRIFC
ncbi:IS5 family transposase [Pseudodesulfovibrio sp.]|uniref:IS5 family transposase n=1 Tax=unclassified Pseudodesulfovibrio TaxID=2661612 RepID=UPI003B00F7EC